MRAVPQQEPRSIHVCYHAIIIIIILLFYFQCLALALVQISAEERENRTEGSGSLPSAPTAVYSLAETSAPLCLQRLQRASRGRMVSTTQPAWDGRALTITPVTQERNQGVDGHLLPSPRESGWTWGPSSWLVPERSLPCGRPGVPMEPALPLQARTFTQGTDRDP